MSHGYLVFALGLLTLTARAEEVNMSDNRLLPWYADATPETAEKKRWVIDVGFEAGFEPDYVGSDDNELEVFPYAAVHLRITDDLRLRALPFVIAGVWDLSDRTAVQLVFEYEEGREATETKDLDLLENGEDTIEAELSMIQRVGKAGFVYATYQPEILDRDKGVVWFVGAGYQFSPTNRWLITPVIDLSWGDGEHMQTEFGLSPDDAAVLGLDPYRASGGLKSSTATLNLQWDWTDRIALVGSAGVEYYFQEAADSPLLDELGSRVGAEIELGLIYTF